MAPSRRDYALVLLLAGLVHGVASAQLVLPREEYGQRLRGMWLAEVVANWTGWRGEARRTEPPFLTDDDWGRDFGRGPLVFVTDQDPWWADDDTDIEYVYMALAGEHGVAMGPEQIAAGWREHINRFIWVSNAKARDLMEEGVRPPSTGLAAANEFWLFIDAQLTTEMFGAISPGMAGVAMEIADLPIRTTSAGHASHAAQFFAVLYSLAPWVDPALEPRLQNLWLVDEARRYLPDGSKTADVIDFVRAEYVNSNDPDDWERARDRIHERYQRDAGRNGFRYRGWTESSINLATAVLCLLFGEGDLRRTIQIGTLSGWDADNPTATMGGLLGLMHGAAWVEQAFPEADLSDRYWISRTRDEMEDHLPGDPQAEDTLTMLSERMLRLVDESVRVGGGTLRGRGANAAWIIPPRLGDPLERNPLMRLDARSRTLGVLRDGGSVTGQSSVNANPTSGGVGNPSFIASGFHADFSGRDVLNSGNRRYYSSENAGAEPGDIQTLTVLFDRAVEVASVRFIEGDHFHDGVVGGWFDAPVVEALVGGNWTRLDTSPSRQLRGDQAFQIVDFPLDKAVRATGIRISGAVGGTDAFVTCAALDALGPAHMPDRNGFDLNLDGVVDVDDLSKWHLDPVDWNADGVIDAEDRRVQETPIRWGETEEMSFPRRP